MAPKFCKKCKVYLLDHENPYLRRDGWKRCPSCGWCCDKEGYNLIDKKEEKQNEQEIQREGAKSNFSENE